MPKKTSSGRNRAGSRNHPVRRRLIRPDSSAPAGTTATGAPSSLPSQSAAAPASRLVRHSAPLARTAFDYSYVVSDLRRIALIFGGIVIALVVLSFFIH